MRYLNSVYTSMPVFCFLFIWGAIGLPIILLAVASLSSAPVGFMLGRYMSAVMAKNLLSGDDHFLLRPVPGGVWFFIGLGLLGGIGGFSVMLAFGSAALEWHVFRLAAVVIGSLFCATFSTIALAVLRLEHTQTKHVYFDREGLRFR